MPKAIRAKKAKYHPWERGWQNYSWASVDKPEYVRDFEWEVFSGKGVRAYVCGMVEDPARNLSQYVQQDSVIFYFPKFDSGPLWVRLRFVSGGRPCHDEIERRWEVWVAK